MMIKPSAFLHRKHSRMVSSGDEGASEMNTMVSSNTPPGPRVLSASALNIRRLTMSADNRSLLEFLNEDRSRQKFCDVSVFVDGRIYRAHKVVLAHGSSYFHAELSKNPTTTHLTVDHVESSVFELLLDFLYAAEYAVSEKDLPALINAARFLDMMDVLKMLCEDGVAHPASLSQAQAEDRKCLDTGLMSSVSPAGGADAQNPFEQSWQSISENSSHRDAQQSASTENELAASITRKSGRRRRTPIKYQRDDVEYFVETQEEKPWIVSPIVQAEARVVDAGEAAAENRVTKVDVSQTCEASPGEDAVVATIVCDEDGEDEAENIIEYVVGSEHDAGQRTDGLSSGPTAGRSTQSPVYPEGLTPVLLLAAKKKILMCPKCNKTFDRAGKYESHTRVHTGEKPFQCEICLQRYSTKSNLTVHKKKHANDVHFPKKDHKCPFCSKLCASPKTLAKHVRRFHPDNIQEFLSKRKRKSDGWKCAICLKVFTRRPHLQEHMILHSQARPFKCAYCDQCFKSRFARLKHHEKFHLGPFPCEICGRQFNDTGNRKRHMECTHGGKRKWTCFICGKSVRERTTLKEHMRIHSGEKPYLCSVCGQSFRHSSSYRLHLRVHHDDKRYECIECGKCFIRHDHLAKHQKIHSGEKAHQCEECGKCFRRQDHLTVHYKSVHLGEKVWQKYKAAVHQCEVCKKEFKGKTSLKMHFRTHSGEKPHQCPECHQTFRIKKTLTKHMVIHSDDRPFNCPHCSATFKRKDKLKYHVDHVHSNRFAEQSVSALGDIKIVSVPYQDTSKVYGAEPKSPLQGPAAPLSVCMPVGVHMTGAAQEELDAHGTVSLQAQGQQQQQNSGYQASTDLAFLEKYTLTPQPDNIAHPVRPDQMMDPREQSYLGTFLGLDSASSVQNMTNSDHTH